MSSGLNKIYILQKLAAPLLNTLQRYRAGHTLSFHKRQVIRSQMKCKTLQELATLQCL